MASSGPVTPRRRMVATSKPPATIALGPIKITVTHSKTRANDTKTNGFYDADALRINLDPDQPDTKRRQSLVHELLHACFDLMGTDKGGRAALFTSEDHEERCVHAL